MSAAKLERKRVNAAHAAARLRTFLHEEVRSDRDAAGVIQAFEFTFEATWKLLQAIAEDQGLAAASPRQAIAAGYHLGLCQGEELTHSSQPIKLPRTCNTIRLAGAQLAVKVGLKPAL